MATNIPPHNLGEVIARRDRADRRTDIPRGLMKHVKGPDFQTADIVMGFQGHQGRYEAGRGRTHDEYARGRAHRAAEGTATMADQ